MRLISINILFLIAGLVFQSCTTSSSTEENNGTIATAALQEQARAVWNKEKANEWYEEQPWLIGANYNTRTSINQLEMWQAATFDTAIVNQELGWAAEIGMNTMRVYLHDLLWQQDSTGFIDRMDTFLKIAAKHDIKPLFVLFDSCWDPFPEAGK